MKCLKYFKERIETLSEVSIHIRWRFKISKNVKNSKFGHKNGSNFTLPINIFRKLTKMLLMALIQEIHNPSPSPSLPLKSRFTCEKSIPYKCAAIFGYTKFPIFFGISRIGPTDSIWFLGGSK